MNPENRLIMDATVALLGVVLCVVSGCEMPRDCEGTTGRVRNGVLRAGVCDNPPWASYHEGVASGIEVELLRDFAHMLNAEIKWTPDSEGDLVRMLERGDLDIVIAGLSESTPWVSHVSLTQPFAERDERKRVMAVRRGENAFLLELDGYLQSRRRSATR